MARGVNDLAAAKAKKQKKIAIIGGVILLGLVAFQGPRTLKMLHHQSATAAPAPAAPAPATPTPATPTSTPATGATGAVTPTSAQLGSDSLVVNADLSPAPLEGQLPDLTSFTTKDPFQQKDDVATTSAGSTAGGSSTNTGSGGQRGKSGATGSTSTRPGISPAPSASPAVVAGTAQISVNGVEETVAKGADFPSRSPMFHLGSLTATTAKISIAGGSLAGGAHTVTLKLGKPLTLMNTADGSRYVIVLVKIGAPTTTPTATPSSSTVVPAAPATTTPTGDG